MITPLSYIFSDYYNLKWKPPFCRLHFLYIICISRMYYFIEGEGESQGEGEGEAIPLINELCYIQN